MSILGSTPDTPAANKWAGRVRCIGTTPPWWATTSIVGVAEIEIAGVLRVLVNVARGKNGGRWFANMPSSKRDGEWVPTFTIDDTELGKLVADAAIGAVQAMTNTAPVAAATVRTVATATAGTFPDDDNPFA